MIKRGKRGVSPVIATVLLILIVIVLALIIFMWARGFVKERVVKFGEDASLVCERVNFQIDATSTDGKVSVDIVNTGNVAIYGVRVKLESPGETSVAEQDELNLAAGASSNVEVTGAADRIVVTPRILGMVGESLQPYTCETIGKEADVGGV